MHHLPQHAKNAPASKAKVLWGLAGAILVTAIVLGFAFASQNRQSSGAAAQSQDETLSASDSSDTSQSENAEQHDPEAAADECVVSFALSGEELPAALETNEHLYQDLPLPMADNQVFGGWYKTEEAAKNLDYTQRIGPGSTVDCAAGTQMLYGAWVSPEANAAADVALPILMYHQFTTNPEGEDNWLRDNYTYIGDFESHLQYIKDNKFYLPDWHEVSAFIDGKLFLPDKSVVITDDDADPSWNELAAPLAEKYQLPITSFVIGVDGYGPELSQYVRKRSHTYDMHSAGENGQGRLVNWSSGAIIADLNKSAEVLRGVKEIVAYPYGHYNDYAKEAVKQAGYELGRTVDQGYVKIGTDKLTLPCVRMNYGAKVPQLEAAIG